MNNVASSRLQKAIERNRAKQAKRSGVANANNVQFASKFRKPTKKSPTSLSYKISSKFDLKNNKISQIFVRLAWIGCFAMVLQLFFSGGGVLEYYQTSARIEERLSRLEGLKNDSKNLRVELKKIASDRAYQKKIIRDNLGYIAKDEYLIVFAKD